MIDASIHYTDEHPTAQICMEDLHEFNIHWILASRIWSKQQQEEHNSIKFCMNRLGLQVLVGHACNRTALKYRTIFLFMLHVLCVYYRFCRRLKTVFLGGRPVRLYAKACENQCRAATPLQKNIFTSEREPGQAACEEGKESAYNNMWAV